MAQEPARPDQGDSRGSPRLRLLPLVPFAYPDWLPTWYVNVLAFSGLVACLLVGMWDTDTSAEVATKPGHAPMSHLLSELGTAIRTHEAWPLFLWFCAVVMTIEFFVLPPNKVPKRWTAAILVVTLGCIALVAAMHISAFANDPIGWITGHLPVIQPPKFSEQEYAIFNTVLNFGLILLFVAEAARHWVSRMRAEIWNPHARIPLEGETDTASAIVVRPRWQELLSVDFFAAGILIVVLAGAYYLVWHITQIPKCYLALPVPTCKDSNQAFTDFNTLSFLDLLLALACFAVGVIALSMAAVARAVKKVGQENVGVADVLNAGNEAVDVAADMRMASDSHLPRPATETQVHRSRREPVVVLPQPQQASGIALYVLLMLRHFIWPVLIFITVSAISVAASIVQMYLAMLDHQHRPGALLDAVFNGDWRNFVLLLLPLALVALAALALVFACATLVFSRTIFRAWLPRLGQVAVLVLNFFWGFALALFIVNVIVWLIAAASPHTGPPSPPEPFMPPALGAYFSLVAFLVYRYGLRRRPPSASTSRAREPVTVPVRPGTTA